jgi:hypothetical protein
VRAERRRRGPSTTLFILFVASWALLAASSCADSDLKEASALDIDVQRDPVPMQIAYPPSPRADWYHILAVLERWRETPPERSLVVLFAGSAGRECTVSDESWAAAVRRQGGPEVVAGNLSSRNKTFRHDVELVRLLPGTRALVFIGVNLGRFAVSPHVNARGPAVLPDDWALPGRVDLDDYRQHHYSGARVWPDERKELEVRRWLRRRAPFFEARYEANLAVLEELVVACLARGFEPVLLDLPRNTQVVGDQFDEPIARYHEGCEALAETYGVPFVDLVDEAGLVSTDFYDLTHLIGSGQAKWEPLLARTAAELLQAER